MTICQKIVKKGDFEGFSLACSWIIFLDHLRARSTFYSLCSMPDCFSTARSFDQQLFHGSFRSWIFRPVWTESARLAFGSCFRIVSRASMPNRIFYGMRSRCSSGYAILGEPRWLWLSCHSERQSCSSESRTDTLFQCSVSVIIASSGCWYVAFDPLTTSLP